MSSLFTLIALLAAGNLFILVQRARKNRNVGKDATEDRIATVRHHDSLVRQLDREQEEAAKYVELQNRMFELFEQVRQNHAAEGKAEE